MGYTFGGTLGSDMRGALGTYYAEEQKKLAVWSRGFEVYGLDPKVWRDDFGGPPDEIPTTMEILRRCTAGNTTTSFRNALKVAMIFQIFDHVTGAWKSIRRWILERPIKRQVIKLLPLRPFRSPSGNNPPADAAPAASRREWRSTNGCAGWRTHGVRENGR